jgi:hypothetical protein
MDYVLMVRFNNYIELVSLSFTSETMQGCVQPDWGYVEWTEQIISINPYKLIQTSFYHDIEKYINFFQNKANNRK